MNNCPTCGFTNNVGSMFCSQCSSPLGAHAVPPPYMNPAASSNAIIVFVLGILSLVVCAVLGPIAWAMGKTELRKIASGESSQAGHPWANAGMICGIIGTVLLGFTVVIMIAWFAMFATHMH